MNNNSWDLYEVVKGYSSSTTITPSKSKTNATNLDTLGCFNSSLGSCSNKYDNFIDISVDHFKELFEVCKPFLPKYNQSQPLQNSPISSSQPPQNSPISSSVILSEVKQRQIAEEKCNSSQVVPSTGTTKNFQPPKSKRRKNQPKRVSHVRGDDLFSDIWTWRKYGQKPIKGSPHPRGYYKCSSSTGCLARKQVERKRSDPTMFVVTYTGEHNHPPPPDPTLLAVSTRKKPNASQVSVVQGDEEASSNAEAANNHGVSCWFRRHLSVEEELGLNTESATIEDSDEDEHVDAVDISTSDDFFEGLDDFIASTSEDHN